MPIKKADRMSPIIAVVIALIVYFSILEFASSQHNFLQREAVVSSLMAVQSILTNIVKAAIVAINPMEEKTHRKEACLRRY